MTYEEFITKVNTQKVTRPKGTSSTGGSRPSDLDIDACIDVLEGGTSRLMQAFSWASTPQGHYHWVSIWEGDVELSIEDEEYIQSLIDTYG